jgi:hypothetical protein
MSNINFKYNLVRGPVKGVKEWPKNSFKWHVELNGISFDYFTGTGLVKPNGSPLSPNVDDVLHSLIMDSETSSDTFEDWCSNFGYDTYSRTALNTYLSCQENAVKLRKTGIDIEKERERLQDY